MDIEDNITIQNYKGKETGLLSVIGTAHGEKGLEDVEDPSELLGKNVRFQIDIKKLLDIPKRFDKVCNSVSLEGQAD